MQPFLYITDNINGNHTPDSQQLDNWARQKYNELFRDEAHMLVVFLEYDGRYSTWYVCGTQAKTVIDQEAADILLDYIDLHYYDDMDEDEYFSLCFDKAAKRIMTGPQSPWLPVIFLGLIVLSIIIFRFWKARVRQKNLETEQAERILNTPIEQIDLSSDPLSEKYDNM